MSLHAALRIIPILCRNHLSNLLRARVTLSCGYDDARKRDTLEFGNRHSRKVAYAGLRLKRGLQILSAKSERREIKSREREQEGKKMKKGENEGEKTRGKSGKKFGEVARVEGERESRLA